MSQENQRIVSEIVLLQKDILTDFMEKYNQHSSYPLQNTVQFVNDLLEVLKDNFIIDFANKLSEIKFKNQAFQKETELIEKQVQMDKQEHETNIRQILVEKNQLFSELQLLKQRQVFLHSKFGSQCVQARIQDLISKKKHLQAANITKDSYIRSKESQIKKLINRQIELGKDLKQIQGQYRKILEKQKRLIKQNQQLKVVNKKLSQRNEEVASGLNQFKGKLGEKLSQLQKNDNKKCQLQAENRDLKILVKNQQKQIKNICNLKQQNEYLRETILNHKQYIQQLKQNQERLTASIMKNETKMMEMLENSKNMEEDFINKQTQFVQTIQELHQTCRQFQRQLDEGQQKKKKDKKYYEEKITHMMNRIEEQEQKLNSQICTLDQQKDSLSQVNKELQRILGQKNQENQELKAQVTYFQQQNSNLKKQLARKVQKFEQKCTKKWANKKNIFFLYELFEQVKRLREENMQMKLSFEKILGSYLKISKKQFFNGVQQILGMKQKCQSCEHWSRYLKQKDNLRNRSINDPQKWQGVPKLKPKAKTDTKRIKKSLHLLTTQNEEAGVRIKSLIKQM